jgi:hypothetical protein
MKTPILMLLLFNVLTSFAGVGGSEGGPGKRSWAPALKSGYIRDWPQVRISQSRTIDVHQVCIQDDATLRTLNKYGSADRISFNRKHWTYRTIDRVFDAKSCYASWDPKCAIASQYVGDQVKVPVYRGQPRFTRGGPESMRDFVSRSRLERFETMKIPHCK